MNAKLWKIGLALTLAMTLLTTSACTPRLAGAFMGAAIMTAAIVGTAAILAEHDAHYHHSSCGCERQFHDGHWVYNYNDGWEYYDDHRAVWYVYRAEPHYQHHQHHHYY